MLKKTIITAILVLSLFTLVSCANADKPPTNANDTTSTADQATTTEAVAATLEKINWESANLPKDIDFEGYNFKIYSQIPNSDFNWWKLGVEEISGEPLNDAIYMRNKTIEEAFNMEISVSYTATSDIADMKKLVQAGDDEFDIFVANTSNQLSMAQSKYLIDFHELKYVDLDRQWWDEALIRDLTLMGKLYFGIGDISPIANVRTYMLIFNKDICNELSLELPYQYVKDGSWTMDKFSSYVKGVNRDLNGDGVMDYEDLWGFFSQYGNSYMMFVAGGGRIAKPDADGVPELVMDTERNIEIISKALSISNDQNITLMADPYVASSGGWPAASQWFASGGSLVRSSVFEPVPRDYRAMESDFGLLPYPKYNEGQEEYYSLTENSAFLVSVPVTSEDPDRTSIILEALSAESVSSVSVAFYDISLNGKIVRDEESADMLQHIFNKVFDLGFLINIGGYRTNIINLEKAGGTDIASTYASMKSQSQAALDELIKAFSED